MVLAVCGSGHKTLQAYPTPIPSSIPMKMKVVSRDRMEPLRGRPGGDRSGQTSAVRLVPSSQSQHKLKKPWLSIAVAEAAFAATLDRCRRIRSGAKYCGEKLGV